MRSNIFKSYVARLTAFTAALLMGASAAAQSLELVLGENLREPHGVAVDPQNNYYVADSANDRIVRLNPETGALSVLAGSTDVDGFADGRGQRALFRNPQGIVSIPVGSAGLRLPNGSTVTTGFVVADTGNHSLRHVALDGTVTTIAGNGQPGSIAQGRLNAPVGLAFGNDGFLYIADAQNNAIRRLNLQTRELQNVVNTGLLQPQGVALDEAGNLYISDTGHHSIKVKAPGGDVQLLAGRDGVNGFINAPFLDDSRFDRPAGLYWAGSRVGLLVADSGNGVVRRISDLNTAPKIETYGSAGNSPLLTPVAIARELGGSFLVADPGRNAVYAIRTSQAPQPPVPAPTIGYVIFTNLFECNGTFLVAVTNGTFNNDIVVAIRGDPQSQTFFIAGPTEHVQDLPPTETPLPYSDCMPSMPVSLINPAPDVTIKAYSTQADRRPSPLVTARFRFKVGNPIVQGSNPASLTLATATADAQIYYSTGTASNPPAEPTQVNGQIYQPGTTINLNVRNEPAIIRARAYRGGYAPSEVVEKQFDPAEVEYSLLGFQRNFIGGPGATVIVPVNLAPSAGSEIRSYQFRAEVRPVGDIVALHEGGSGGAPEASIALLGGNDFVPYAYAAKENQGFLYSTETSQGIVVAALGNPEDPGITNSAAVAILAIGIPTNAHPGQRYELSIREVSATSDGNQRAVAITNLPPVRIVVQNTSFVVGDTAPATWYNAGEFGDSELRNNDVNAAFLASLGLRVPYTVSDAFKAMDAYPPDTEFRRGGDNQIRFLDWQTILVRSVGLDSNNWIRWYGPNGLTQSRTNLPLVAGANASSKVQALAVGGDAHIVWNRPAQIGSRRVSVAGGSVVRVPIYLKADPGVEISGMHFIARVEAVGRTPAFGGTVTFVPSPGFAPTSSGRVLPGGITLETGFYATYNLGALRATGSNIIGHATFTVPSTLVGPSQYVLRFTHADGSSGATIQTATQLDFESVAGAIVVGATPVRPELALADEWVAHFFGGEWPGTLSDPDRDGLPNHVEFANGTHPLENDSRLELQTAASSIALGQYAFRWYAAAGVKYTLETTANLDQPWSPAAQTIEGQGGLHIQTYSQPAKDQQFFRLRVIP